MVKYFGFNHVQWPQSECQRFFGDGDDNTDDGCDVDDDNDVDDILMRMMYMVISAVH